MKNKILTIFLLTGFTISMLAGCGKTETASTADTQATESATQPEATEESTAIQEPTEESHTHNYTEVITTQASCETDGLKTFTCECGDTYTEPIPAIGHVYENYIFNNDATYTTDGTETATCVCGLTDIRTAEGSKLEITCTDMQATMYAQQTVNIRDLPSTDGNKVGSLSTNDEVKVTGQVDNGWYRIEYNGSVSYVSNSYMGENKVEVAQAVGSAASSGNWYDGYEMNVWYDMGLYMYKFIPESEHSHYYSIGKEAQDMLNARYPDRVAISGGTGPSKEPEGTVCVVVSALQKSPSQFADREEGGRIWGEMPYIWK